MNSAVYNCLQGVARILTRGLPSTSHMHITVTAPISTPITDIVKSISLMMILSYVPDYAYLHVQYVYNVHCSYVCTIHVHVQCMYSCTYIYKYMYMYMVHVHVYLFCRYSYMHVLRKVIINTIRIYMYSTCTCMYIHVYVRMLVSYIPAVCGSARLDWVWWCHLWPGSSYTYPSFMCLKTTTSFHCKLVEVTKQPTCMKGACCTNNRFFMGSCSSYYYMSFS